MYNQKGDLLIIEAILLNKTLSVAAAIIENETHEFLCALRSTTMSIPNRWEFPGGKVQAGESTVQAIEREIKEELNCTIRADEPFLTAHHDYDNFSIDLHAIRCTLVSGFPESQEHDKLVWLKRENLDSLNWAPADIPIMEQLIQTND